MREMWARRIAMLTGGLVVLLAVVFARIQNPSHNQPMASLPVPVVKPAAPQTPPSLIEAGQQVYAEQACARCHSIVGRGGARSVLDGVGARLSEEEIRAWITPHAKAAKGFQARHADIRLKVTQRDALVAYLRSLQ